MALEMAKKQLKIAQNLNDERLILQTKIHISYYFISKKQFEKAHQIISEQQKRAEKSKDPLVKALVAYAWQKLKEKKI